MIFNDPQVAAEFGTNPLVISADPVTNDANVFADNSWTSDDYRFVIDYQWSDDVFTYLSWSTAYKAGGFADFINDDTGSAAVTEGRDGIPGTGDEISARFGLIPYNPESVEGYELGLRSEWLDAEEIRDETKAWLRTGATRPWQDAQYAYTLAQILRNEEDWEGAYEALMGRVRDPEQLREAALWLGEPAPGRACELYALAMEALIAKKNKRGYRAAVEVLLEAKPYFDLTGPDEFAHFVARLRATHKQKRNLMAALDAAL